MPHFSFTKTFLPVRPCRKGLGFTRICGGWCIGPKGGGKKRQTGKRDKSDRWGGQARQRPIKSNNPAPHPVNGLMKPLTADMAALVPTLLRWDTPVFCGRSIDQSRWKEKEGRTPVSGRLRRLALCVSATTDNAHKPRRVCRSLPQPASQPATTGRNGRSLPALGGPWVRHALHAGAGLHQQGMTTGRAWLSSSRWCDGWTASLKIHAHVLTRPLLLKAARPALDRWTLTHRGSSHRPT